VEPRVAQQALVWLRVAQLGMPKPREAQHASSRPHGAQILKGLPVQAEEPQVARSPGNHLGGLAGHRGGRTCRGESGPDGGNHGTRLQKKI
jgi:hypothetical protein